MKTERNILIAFILNLFFSAFELFGGIFTGSVAIISDSIHDIGDAMGIGVSYLLEKKSRKKPDGVYTYGYARLSVMGSVITTLILLVGSVLVVVNAIKRIINPSDINYNGMIVFAVVGVVVNFLAAKVTHGSESLNQKAVNLHMLEDVLGWIVVLVGSVVMKFTDFAIIDPLMSIGVAVFILVNAVKNLKKTLDVFLEKVPEGTSVEELKHHLCEIDSVLDVHHIHLWTMDGQNNYATMHVVTDGNPYEVKAKIREELAEHNICHVTLELESIGEDCHEKCCEYHAAENHSHSHGHHHHH